MSKEFNLIVNGQSCLVSLDYDQTPLLYVLRDDLQLKGARLLSSEYVHPGRNVQCA